jgi:hypothetical protein
LLSDDEQRKKYDMYGHQKSGHQQQQHHRNRGGFNPFQHFQQQQQQQQFHEQMRQQQARQRAEDAQREKYRRAQERVMFVNNLSHLRNVAIDDDTGRVDKHFLLALYNHGGGCESLMNDRIIFPYPFAHNSDAVGIWWEDVIQTAKALSHEQVSFDI